MINNINLSIKEKSETKVIFTSEKEAKEYFDLKYREEIKKLLKEEEAELQRKIDRYTELIENKKKEIENLDYNKHTYLFNNKNYKNEIKANKKTELKRYYSISKSKGGYEVKKVVYNAEVNNSVNTKDSNEGKINEISKYIMPENLGVSQFDKFISSENRRIGRAISKKLEESII